MLLPEVDPARCLRFRCRTFPCSRCSGVCPRGALPRDAQTPAVDRRSCTGCGLCVSACPVDGLCGPAPDVPALAAGLASLAQPVLGCTGGDGVEAHARLPCLGYLTPEDLAALSVLLPQGLQLNALRCSTCARGGIEEILAARVSLVAGLRPGGDLRLIRSGEDLSFRERSFDRRTFLRSLGRSTAVGASRLLKPGAAGEEPAGGRSAKYLPRRRGALNVALGDARPPAAARLAEAFSFSLAVDDGCTACPRCSAMCPTGALTRVGEGSGRRLRFDPARCTGCGVCVAFCPGGSLRLESVRGDGGKAPGAHPPRSASRRFPEPAAGASALQRTAASPTEAP